jgi:DUF1009 family protein
MDTQFDLKSVVGFLEGNGFRVKEARERFWSGFRSLPEIEVKIARKDETPVCLREVMGFMEAGGFNVLRIKEIYRWDGEKQPYSVELTIRELFPASQAHSLPDSDQAERGC